MQFKNEKFVVFGMRISGYKVAEFLLSSGAEVGLYDDDKTVFETNACNLLIEKGAKIVDYIEENEENYDARKNEIYNYDIVVVSPGVNIDNPLLVKLKRLKKRIIGEVELAYKINKAPIISVSGTNGKTTVSTLIHSALLNAGESCYLLGNIGTPFISEADNTAVTDVCVLEVSSFQLESVRDFAPHIGIMLNVTEDHLDRHYTMENYVYLKKRMFSNMCESEYAVLNYDDQTVRSFQKDLKCRVVWFSVKEKVDGAYISSGKIYYGDKQLFDIEDLKLKGEHNIENVLACVCALKIYGIDDQTITKSLTDFGGVKYRLQNIGEYNGVTYFNDSKSTNVDSTLKAVRAMDKESVLILGGRDKNQDYTELFTELKNCNLKIKHTVLTGENRYKLLKTATDAEYNDISVTSDLLSAVGVAKTLASVDGAVLFSPGAASFDAFKDYKERGDRFDYIVKTLNET